MRAYKAYVESGIEECGEIAKAEVSSLIAQADAALNTDQHFAVGFYRSEKDFVEIRPVGKSEYMVWSDRITANASSGFLGFFAKSKRHIDSIVTSREQAVEAVFYYMDHSRKAFEQKYG
jgi:hypothetical protein